MIMKEVWLSNFQEAIEKAYKTICIKLLRKRIKSTILWRIKNIVPIISSIKD